MSYEQDMLNEYRKRVLSVSHADLVRVTELFLNRQDHPTGRYILGPNNDDLKSAGFVVNQ